MSSESPLRFRSPASSRISTTRRNSPTISTPRKRPLLSDPVDILPKCSSEPSLFPGPPTDGWFYRQMTCTDVLSPSLLSPSRPNEVYHNDTKVVVTVTVEGSTGPIRTMVRLGTTVEETIQLLIDKYHNEGRFPRLDKNAASLYELHLSYFSLESLDRSESIGDVGSRTFYLRKGTPILQTVIKGTHIAAPTEAHTSSSYQSRPWMSMSFLFFPSYVTRKTSKIARRMRRLWKVMGCLHCSA